MIPVDTILVSARMQNVQYAIRDIVVLADEVAAGGKTLLPLNIGDPLNFDFATPPHLVEAAVKAMREGKNGYAPSSGIEGALEAIRLEAARKGIGNIQDVFVTSGVSEAIDICLTALLNSDENVLCPSPDYPFYSAIVGKLGFEPNEYELDESHGWEPDLDDLRRKINTRTRAIVLNNPNNPTGAVYSRPTLEAIAELARRHNLVVFADEIYEKLVFEGEHVSIAALASDIPVITFTGLSKNYLAPGWRIGWGIASGPEAALAPYLDGINRLLRARLCAAHPMMYAIQPALEGPQDHLKVVKAKLRSRAALTVQWASSTPRVSCVPPKGAFYAYPQLDIPDSDEEFVKQLLRETGVLLVHGSGFGQAPGTKHCRIVFLPQEQILKRAFQSITAFLETHYGS